MLLVAPSLEFDKQTIHMFTILLTNSQTRILPRVWMPWLMQRKMTLIIWLWNVLTLQKYGCCMKYFISNLPFSAFLLDDGELYVVVGNTIGVHYYHLYKELYNAFHSGLCCQSLILNEATTAANANGLTKVLDYCMLLPELFGGDVIDEVLTTKFAVIASKWKALQSVGQFWYCKGIQSMSQAGEQQQANNMH